MTLKDIKVDVYILKSIVKPRLPHKGVINVCRSKKDTIHLTTKLVPSAI